MKFEKTQVTVTTIKDTVAMLLPKFGTVASPNIPGFIDDCGMYLVHQDTSLSGNRYLTFVGISKELIIEVLVGLHHGIKYLDKVTASIGDGETFVCFLVQEYTEKTHFTPERLRSDLELKLTEYVTNQDKGNTMSESDIETKVKKILNELFSHKPADLDRRGIRPLLKGYCRLRHFCSDFVNDNIKI